MGRPGRLAGWGLVLMAAGSCVAAVPHAAPGVENRCGWFDNPSPGNASLIDRDGEWVVAQQGDFEAKGRWPAFGRSLWVRTGNGSAGHGCVCMTLKTDKDAQRVREILSSRPQPLKRCRSDRKLTEPLNPLG